MRATFSSDISWLARETTSLILVITSSPLDSSLLSGEGSATITGRPPSGAVSAGLPGEPPLSWITAMPVTPVSASLAWVSCLIGVSAPRRMRASTRRGSFGSSLSWLTSPTLIPLYCTALPCERPLTASLNTIWYSANWRSVLDLASHRPNSSAAATTITVNRPIKT